MRKCLVNYAATGRFRVGYLALRRLVDRALAVLFGASPARLYP